MSLADISFVGLAERITTNYKPYMKKLGFVGVLHEVLPENSDMAPFKVLLGKETFCHGLSDVSW